MPETPNRRILAIDENSHSYRLSFLGLIAWLSVCLVIAGWFPNLTPNLAKIWVLAGVFGIAASVGLLVSAKAEVRSQQQLLESYISEARTDALTGLANRRALEIELDNRSAMWRQGHPLCLILLDVDHFKAFNDQYGHQAGDEMLRRVASLLRDPERHNGLAARYGGEEFAIVLPSTFLGEAIDLAEQIRQDLDNDRFEFRGMPLHVTISIGIAQACPADTVEQLIRRADTGLFTAKKGGRNAVAQGRELLPPQMAVSG